MTLDPKSDSFFKDHWVHIDSSRFAVYDKLFNLPPAALKTLLGPLDLQPGQTALDLGCGPGYVSAGIAQLVGPTGKVHGVDVNKPFCDRAVEVAKAQNLPNVTIHHVHDETLPLATSSLDRTVMKNVLEYVPSMDSTLSEVYRCTKPGGRILALDSDWSFLLVEPWSADEVREVFGGAAPAFREPNIGRKLRAGFRKAGFTEINVEIRANPDTGGQLRGVIGNMLNYGKQFGTVSEARAKELGDRVDAAIKDGSYMMVLPQFVVTGIKPAGGAGGGSKI